MRPSVAASSTQQPESPQLHELAPRCVSVLRNRPRGQETHGAVGQREALGRALCASAFTLGLALASAKGPGGAARSGLTAKARGDARGALRMARAVRTHSGSVARGIVTVVVALCSGRGTLQTLS